MVRSMENLPDCLLPAYFSQVKGYRRSVQRFPCSVSCPQVLQGPR